MALMMSSLLAYGELVPARARDVLRAASGAPPGANRALRRVAARELFQSADVDCRDALELVDLDDPDTECGCA